MNEIELRREEEKIRRLRTQQADILKQLAEIRRNGQAAMEKLQRDSNHAIEVLEAKHEEIDREINGHERDLERMRDRIEDEKRREAEEK